MALGDITPFQKFIQTHADKDILSSTPVDFNTDTIKVMLLDNTYSPDTTDSSATEHVDDVSAKEVITGTTYTGPITLTTPTVTISGGVTTFDADDVSIGVDASGFTNARYIVLYKDSGVEATSPLVAVGDLGSDRDITGAILNLNWAATGLITWS